MKQHKRVLLDEHPVLVDIENYLKGQDVKRAEISEVDSQLSRGDASLTLLKLFQYATVEPKDQQSFEQFQQMTTTLMDQYMDTVATLRPEGSQAVTVHSTSFNLEPPTFKCVLKQYTIPFGDYTVMLIVTIFAPSEGEEIPVAVCPFFTVGVTTDEADQRLQSLGPKYLTDLKDKPYSEIIDIVKNQLMKVRPS